MIAPFLGCFFLIWNMFLPLNVLKFLCVGEWFEERAFESYFESIFQEDLNLSSVFLAFIVTY